MDLHPQIKSSAAFYLCNRDGCATSLKFPNVKLDSSIPFQLFYPNSYSL